MSWDKYNQNRRNASAYAPIDQPKRSKPTPGCPKCFGAGVVADRSHPIHTKYFWCSCVDPLEGPYSAYES